MSDYASNYIAGLVAGREYPWPAEWRDLFRAERGSRYPYWPRHPRLGIGAMTPQAVMGWVRGFRHGCMESAS